MDELYQLKGNLRGMGYSVERLRKEVMDMAFQARGLSGDEMYKSLVDFNQTFAYLSEEIEEITKAIDKYCKGTEED